MIELLAAPPRHLFFTGKGGTGKTSIACASAIALADRGRRVLLVSTDPASNLDEVLGASFGPRATALPSVKGLFALNLDPEAAARDYREKIVGPFRGKVPAGYLAQMEEQLSGACTVEVAAFDEFAKLIGDPAATAEFDHVLFDTAPTGHTLRLLALAPAWSEFVRTNSSGASCLGPLAGLAGQRALYQATIDALSDGARTLLVLVTRPEPSALLEADRTSGELRAAAMTNQHLVVNALFRPSLAGDAIADAFARRGRAALDALPARLAALPRSEAPLHPHALLGVPALRAFAGAANAADDAPTTAFPVEKDAILPPALGPLVDAIERAGKGVVMTMGKGGVGKTTIAGAIAVELARRGHPVHLTTTDPAAHLDGAVPAPLPNLSVGRIDPARETERYVAEVLATAGAALDADGRALLEEDLRSPCTEEVAVFRAFARTVDEGAGGFVVLDTAPTGHTLLLLDAAEAYHREVLRRSDGVPDAVKRLLPRLRDPSYTRILIVTLAEATPVHEAARLQEDLRRAQIEPFAWVINQSLTAVETRDPVLASRRHDERACLDEVSAHHARTLALVPWMALPPVGAERLAALL